ncbi:MAG: DUF1415 family protein [Sandaracinaceae bacterium]|nr:DUF1415 family protein [Sandaracinaceae bacterium]
MTRDARLAQQAVRVYRRYAVEIVEALGFCPYAQRCREEGRTREVVLSAPIPEDPDVLGAIEQIAEDERVEIGLLLFPRLSCPRAKLGRWVEHLRKAHAAKRGAAVLALEGFHPDATADTTSADRLTPFVRRTPDPTVQLTRLCVLDRVRRGTPQGTAFFDPSSMDVHALLEETAKPPLHDRIAQHNLESVLALGASEVARRMDAILRDRDAAYLAIDPEIPRRLASG